MKISTEAEFFVRDILLTRNLTISDIKDKSSYKAIATLNSIIRVLHLSYNEQPYKIAAFFGIPLKYVSGVLKAPAEKSSNMRTTNYGLRGSRGRRVGRKGSIV